MTSRCQTRWSKFIGQIRLIKEQWSWSFIKQKKIVLDINIILSIIINIGLFSTIFIDLVVFAWIKLLYLYSSNFANHKLLLVVFIFTWNFHVMLCEDTSKFAIQNGNRMSLVTIKSSAWLTYRDKNVTKLLKVLLAVPSQS